MRRGVVLIGVILFGASLGLLAITGGTPTPGARHRRDQSPPRTAVSGGIALLDANRGVIEHQVASDRIQQPYEARYQDGRFWLFDAGGPSLVAINPRSGQVTRTLRSPIRDVGSYVVTPSALWVTDEQHGTVTAISPRDGHTLRSFRHLPGNGGSVGVAVIGHSLWVARPEALKGDGILAILNLDTGQLVGQIRGQPGSYELASDTDGSLWTGGTHGAVNHINPQARTVTYTNVGGQNYSIAVADHHLWTTDTTTGSVYELNRGPSVVAQYDTTPGADTIAHTSKAAWVGNSHDGTVTRITPSGHQHIYAFDHTVTALAAGHGIILIGFGKPLPKNN